MRRLTYVLLFAAPVLWLCLWALEQELVKAGVLNLKDLTFVGNETGTWWEHLTNAWHWDLALMVLFLASVVCPFIGITRLMRGRKFPQCA